MLGDRRNPFEPEAEGAPLRLTFDSCSLSRLTGQARADADYLLSLSHTPQIDGLVAWAMPGFAEDLPSCFAYPTPGRPDDLTVSLTDDPKGFIGGVPMSGQWAAIAESYEMEGERRDSLVHYGQVTTFHGNAGRHLFITAYRQLLRARDEGPLKTTWIQHGVLSVNQALALAGALMRIYGRSYEHAQPRYLQHINNYTLFFRLTGAAMPNRLRFVKRWLEIDGQGRPAEHEMQRLQQSLFDRTMDLFRARDYAQRENLRRSHNNATVEEILYHLRAGVATLAAACDSLAALSALALEVPDSELPDPQRIGFEIQDFRQNLKSHDGQQLADAAAAAGPVLTVLKRFRDPIIHSSGPRGSPLIHLDAPRYSETRADITPGQHEALEGLGKATGRPERWGLRLWGDHAAIDPVAFVNQLAIDGMELLDDLFGALCDDLQVSDDPVELPTPEPRLRRLRLLTGLAP